MSEPKRNKSTSNSGSKPIICHIQKVFLTLVGQLQKAFAIGLRLIWNVLEYLRLEQLKPTEMNALVYRIVVQTHCDKDF
jgi:hypothetical protein